MFDADRRRWLGAAVAGLALPPLAAPWLHRARAADRPRFALGVASGHPTPDGVVLWTRLVGEDLPAAVPVRWELAADEAFRQVVARGDVTARADEAHTARAEPAGLAPGRPWWYRFEALGDRSATGRTCTAPAPDARVDRLVFAIASCQRWEHGRWAAWRHLAAQDLDLVLFLGDYVYEYADAVRAVRRHGLGEIATLDDYRARYALYRTDPALQAAHAAAPWFPIWDDHEVQNDYAGLQPQDLAPGFAARRAAAYRAWWEHMPVPRSMKPAADGGVPLAGRLAWGRLATLHRLDTRQHRDPQPCPRPGRGGSNTVFAADCPALQDPSRSLLGRAQEDWLARGWDRGRPWNLVAQTTLVAPLHGADPHSVRGPLVWTDRWDGYPAARRRLAEGLQAAGVTGAVLLGGDTHAHQVADLHRDPDDPASPVVAAEFVGTSISSRGRSQAQLDALRGYNPHLHLARTDVRGATRFVLTPGRLDAELLAVRDPADDASAVDVLARFAVEPGRPGVSAA